MDNPATERKIKSRAQPCSRSAPGKGRTSERGKREGEGENERTTGICTRDTSSREKGRARKKRTKRRKGRESEKRTGTLRRGRREVESRREETRGRIEGEG